MADCVRAWSQRTKVQVRNLNATRPWQHVLEPLSGYLLLGQKLYENPELNGEPFNFGPNGDQNYKVSELIAEMQKIWEGTGVENVQNSNAEKKEHALLKLCCDKALHVLGWRANLGFKETVQFTIEWYRKYYEQKEDILNVTCRQIEEYVKIARSRGQIWVKND